MEGAGWVLRPVLLFFVQKRMRREDQGNLDALDRSPACSFPDVPYLGGPVIAEVEDAHRRKPRVAELLVVVLLVGLLYMKTLENSRNDNAECVMAVGWAIQ